MNIQDTLMSLLSLCIVTLGAIWKFSCAFQTAPKYVSVLVFDPIDTSDCSHVGNVYSYIFYYNFNNIHSELNI